MTRYLLVVVALVALSCSSPTAPVPATATLTVATNQSSAITVKCPGHDVGNFNITRLEVVMPTQVDLTVIVARMDGLGTQTRTLSLTGDETLSVLF